MARPCEAMIKHLSKNDVAKPKNNKKHLLHIIIKELSNSGIISSHVVNNKAGGGGFIPYDTPYADNPDFMEKPIYYLAPWLRPDTLGGTNARFFATSTRGAYVQDAG